MPIKIRFEGVLKKIGLIGDPDGLRDKEYCEFYKKIKKLNLISEIWGEQLKFLAGITFSINPFKRFASEVTFPIKPNSTQLSERACESMLWGALPEALRD